MATQMTQINSVGASVGIESFGKLPKAEGLKTPFAGLFKRAGRPGAPGILSKKGLLVMACQIKAPFELLAKTRPVVGMDMRGQVIRGSKVEDKDVDMAKCNADIDSVRRSLGAQKVALVGYSPGGFFMTHYALAQPENVSALVLIEPAIFTDTEDLLKRARLAEEGDGVGAMSAMLNYIDPGLKKEQRLKEARVVCKDWQSPQIMGKIYRLHAEEQIKDEDLAKLREIPLLLIGGTKSPMNFHVKRIAAAVPTAAVWWIEGATHLDLMSDKYADEISRIVQMFLARVE